MRLCIGFKCGRGHQPTGAFYIEDDGEHFRIVRYFREGLVESGRRVSTTQFSTPEDALERWHKQEPIKLRPLPKTPSTDDLSGLTPNQAAEYLGVSTGQLWLWRDFRDGHLLCESHFAGYEFKYRCGPEFRRVRNWTIRYSIESIDHWLTELETYPKPDAPPPFDEQTLAAINRLSISGA